MNSYRRSPECRHSSRGQEQVKPCLRRAVFPKQSRAMVLVWETQLVTLKCGPGTRENWKAHLRVKNQMRNRDTKKMHVATTGYV